MSDGELSVSCLLCVDVKALYSNRSSVRIGAFEHGAEAPGWTERPARIVGPGTVREANLWHNLAAPEATGDYTRFDSADLDAVAT